MRYAVLALLSLAMSASCGKLQSGLVPTAELLSAPTSISVGGQQLTLGAELWRDFMPTIGPSEPDGKPLAAVMYFTAATGTVPAGLRIDRVWVVFGDEQWETATLEEHFFDRYEVVARNGPKWGPGVNVHVIVSVTGAGASGLLRASNVPIGRTD